MSAIAHQPHPVTRAVAAVRDQLAGVADAAVWSLDAAETTAALDDVLGAEAQLAELKARLLSHADRIDIAAETGATSTANWHAHQTRTRRPVAFAAMRLAAGLERHDLIRTALAAGRVQVEQAESSSAPWTTCPTTSTPTSSPRPNDACSSTLNTSTPKPSRSWAAGSSTSSTPRPPTPTKPSSSKPRNAPRRSRPG